MRSSEMVISASISWSREKEGESMLCINAVSLVLYTMRDHAS